MSTLKSLTSEAIIADTMRRGPEVEVASTDGHWRFCRWRQFVGSYSLPALPDPLFVVQLAGKTDVRFWDRDGWTENTSFPGAATIVPATQPTRWLVDGELDVVTLSMDLPELQANAVASQFRTMRFAFSDPLGTALANQILAELYAPASEARDAYVKVLIDALKGHMLRGPLRTSQTAYPTSAFASHRIHRVVNAILDRPGAPHSLEDLARCVGVTETHLCRMFKSAVGMSPHQYVLKARLDRACQMLGQSEASMNKIADLLGFGSQSQFTRAFRNYTGKTPSQFRRESTGGVSLVAANFA